MFARIYCKHPRNHASSGESSSQTRYKNLAMAPCCSSTSHCSARVEVPVNSSCSGGSCHSSLDLSSSAPANNIKQSQGSCNRLRLHGLRRETSELCHAEKAHQHSESCCPKPTKNICTPAFPVVTNCSDNICYSITYPEDTMSTVIQIDDEPCTTVDRERITLGVQGMTCTGCQSNLHNVLDSIKEVSHITTSLLHGQAEFNLKASASVNSGNIARIVQHKTGFTCTKLHHNGEDLDLVLPVGRCANCLSAYLERTFVGKSAIRNHCTYEASCSCYLTGKH